MDMPMTIAFLAFVAVKLVGYAVAAKALARVFPDPTLSAGSAGFVRLLIGLATILVLNYGGHALLGAIGLSFGFLAVRFAFRFVEWRGFLALVHPQAKDRAKIAIACAVGAVYSEILDIPALLVAFFAFDAAGGSWNFIL